MTGPWGWGSAAVTSPEMYVFSLLIISMSSISGYNTSVRCSWGILLLIGYLAQAQKYTPHFFFSFSLYVYVTHDVLWVQSVTQFPDSTCLMLAKGAQKICCVTSHKDGLWALCIQYFISPYVCQLVQHDRCKQQLHRREAPDAIWGECMGCDGRRGVKKDVWCRGRRGREWKEGGRWGRIITLCPTTVPLAMWSPHAYSSCKWY